MWILKSLIRITSTLNVNTLQIEFLVVAFRTSYIIYMKTYIIGTIASSSKVSVYVYTAFR